MSDDIVTRLREADAWFRSVNSIPESESPSLLMQAVEEIKLLRSLNTALAASLEAMKKEVERLQKI